MTKLIKNWEELAKVPPNDKYKIVIDEDVIHDITYIYERDLKKEVKK